jgi:hypothetical protein
LSPECLKASIEIPTLADKLTGTDISRGLFLNLVETLGRKVLCIAQLSVWSRQFVFSLRSSFHQALNVNQNLLLKQRYLEAVM